MTRWFLLPWAFLVPATAGAGGKKIDFAHDILPILKARCAECHTNGKYKGSLSFDTREDVLKTKVALPGKSKESELLRRVSATDKERMPPKGEALSPKEIALLKAWIDDGLAWEPGFSFKKNVYVAPLKPRRPKLPDAAPGLEHPIDRIVGDYFMKRAAVEKKTVDLTKAMEAVDDVAFIRRVFLDLVGMLPTPAEVDAFLADKSVERRDRLIRKVLGESRSYAEHWLTFWNDMLRNNYSGTGYIDGGRKQISTWLYRSLLENKPFDQFTRELINPTQEAEGFILGIKWRGEVNASQVVELQFSQNVSQVFFGANLKCASCHDSFIDDWKLDDAYALAAVVSNRPLEIHRCDKATGSMAKARFLWPELGDIDAKLPRNKRLEEMARLVTHPDNGRFTRTIVNRIWQRMMGRGIVHPVDVMANRPWSEDLLDYLATYFSDSGYDLKRLMEHIATSRTYQLRPVIHAKEPIGEDYVFRGPELRRMQAEQFLDALWMITNTGPVKAAAPVKLAEFTEGVPGERRRIRAALVNDDALMRSLGRPMREQVVTTRPDLLTTLQALDLANGQTLDDMLTRGAAYLLKQHGKASNEEFTEAIYRRALSRRPTKEELLIAGDLLGGTRTVEGTADLLWAVFMLPEFQLVR